MLRFLHLLAAFTFVSHFPPLRREALRADESRYALIKADDDLHEKVFGSDIEAFQVRY